MPNVSKFNYTYDEIRQMLLWELIQKGTSQQEAERASAALTDNNLAMWESAGLTSRIDLQARLETFRQKTK
jgi:LDH2 family malate/lactate/ureidoglycolate dehydrogenase